MPDEQPRRDEVLLQLDKILSHPHFVQSTLQAEVLEMMVKWTLNNKAFDGHTLGEKIVPLYNRATDSGIRKAKKFLLEWLQDYYRSDGQTDNVLIRLSDTGYSVTFSYNPAAIFQKQMDMARTLVGQYSPLRMREALESVDPQNVPPGNISYDICFCEVFLALACFDTFNQPGLLKKITIFITNVVEIEQKDPTNWRGRAALAATNLLGGSIPLARTNFSLALALNREATARYGWYWVFLITDRRIPKAIELITTYCDENPTDAFSRAVLAMAHYLARDFSAALSHADQSITLNNACWFGHLIRGLIQHQLDQERDAILSYLLMQRAMGVPGYDCFTGLLLLFTTSDAMREEIKPVYGETFSRVIGKREDGSYDWLNVALGFANSVPDFAAKAFCTGMGERYFPPYFWASLWPFFDPLRQQSEFTGMVEHMENVMHRRTS